MGSVRPLRRGFALAPLLAALALAGPTAAAAEANGGPRIRFEKTDHDFGKIPSDRKETLKWVFHNDGDEPLKIVSTRPSCACTALVVQTEPIPPGGTGTIDVTYDPTGQYGQVRKTVAVTSNDLANRVVLLSMKAEVIPSGNTEIGNGHPSISGQSPLMGPCGSCHSAPARGKSGAALYTAVCAMCHGPKAEGGRAPSLRDASDPGTRDDKALADTIAYGTVDPRMPGYSDMMGGPLDKGQIESLVRLLREWGPGAAVPAKK
jgi:cytochrome c5